MAYAAVRAATLAVKDVTLAVSVALFSISCKSVVCYVVVAAVRLSRYLSKRVKVSGEIVKSSAGVTALTDPP